MEKRPYGKTGEQVSVIGLGSGFINCHSFTDGVATVRRALERGINYFDTSPHYGKGASQAIFGEGLEGRSDNVIVATKIGYFSRQASYRMPAALSAQLDDNLRLLRRETVDVLQVHESDWHKWWSDEPYAQTYLRPDCDYDFANAPVMQFLQEARDEGRCRFSGVTGNGAANVARVLQYVEVDAVLVAFNYDLIWRDTRRRVSPLAREKGSALILAAIFQGAKLAEVHPEWLQSPPQWMTPQIRSRFERLCKLQRECGLSLVELIIRFLLADPDVTMMLVGAARPAEVDQSVDAAEAGPLPADLHEAVDALGIEAAHPWRLA